MTPERVDALQDAVVRRRKVALDYENRAHQPTRRIVDPWGLVAKGDVWYLVAGTETGQRTFRVDRIVGMTVTDLVAERPSDFHLSREWGLVVEHVERRRSLLSATLLIDGRLLPVLRDHFGRHCEPLDKCDDGRVRVRVAAPMALSIAEHLAGWGAAVEVLEPDSVKAELPASAPSSCSATRQGDVHARSRGPAHRAAPSAHAAPGLGRTDPPRHRVSVPLRERLPGRPVRQQDTVVLSPKEPSRASRRTGLPMGLARAGQGRRRPAASPNCSPHRNVIVQRHRVRP